MTRSEDEKQLIVSGEQKSLTEMASHSLVARAGFSPEFPQRLMKLNDALRRASPRVSAVSFDMIPGATPDITTGIEYESTIGLHIKGFPQTHRAEFELGTEFDALKGINVAVDDIREFVRSVFPGQNATVIAEEDHYIEEKSGPFVEDLQNVTQDQLSKLNEFKKILPYTEDSEGGSGLPYHSFDVKLDNQEIPLLQFTLEPGWYILSEDHSKQEWGVACKIYHIAHKGSTEEIEKFMDAVARLTGHNTYYPFKK